MAYQINLTGQEIDERLQNIGTAEDVAAADGTLYARISKNADDVDELRDTVGHIDSAQTATDKTVTQHTADISTLQTAVGNNKTEQDAIAQKVEKNATAIGEHTTTLTEHDARQTNIEGVVSGARMGAYFSLRFLNLMVDSKFIADIDNIKVVLYRWSGKRYAELKLFTKNGYKESQEIIQYVIILKQEKKDGANIRTPYIHYNDDATEETLVEALKNAFGGRISYSKNKKKRWRLQAFLNGKPITAPFDFRVSINSNDECFLTKGGMMRSVPSSGSVVYDGLFNGSQWVRCKKGDLLDLSYSADAGILFPPSPGNIIVGDNTTKGCVVAVKNITQDASSVTVLWTLGDSLYEIGVERRTESDEYVYRCTSPAKKLCDDIYDYASKMSSGTLRDLYISAGAVYNEQTGYYELNGLTDITEEEMRTIWQEDLSGWYLKGRTNLTRNIDARGNAGGYNGGIDISSICWNNSNITKFNFGAAPYARYMDNAFSGCTKLKTIDTRSPIIPFGGIVGPNTFRNCPALEEVRFYMGYLYSSTNVNFPASPLISKDSVLSVIQTTPTTGSVKPLVVVGLNESAYNRLKDDTDIQQALTEKNGFVTLTQI